MSQLFHNLKTKLQCTQSLRDHISALSDSDWTFQNSFYVHYLPKRLFVRDFKLVKLMTEFGCVPCVFRIPPMRMYNWHVDADRSCAVNVLLNAERCVTLYCVPGESRQLFGLEEVKYEQDACVLMNTEVAHAVLNFEGTRDVLSIGFGKKTSYGEVLKYCVENDL